MIPQLTFLGTARLPASVQPNWTSQSAWFGIAHRPKTGNLVILGHREQIPWCEIKLPTVLDGRMSTAVGVPFDPTRGNFDPAWPTGAGTSARGVNAMYIDADDWAWCTVRIWYNVSNASVPAFFATNLTTNEFRGYWSSTNPTIRTAGYISRLPRKLRETWGQNLGFALASGSGTAQTCAGPGIHSWQSSLLTPHAIMGETPRLGWTLQTGDPYHYGPNQRAWDGVCQCISMLEFPEHVAWIGRTPTPNAQVWYGPNASIAVNGVTYPDPCNDGKGYRASGYSAVMWFAHVDDILAGNRKITELDLSSLIPNACKMVSACVDPVAGRLYVLAFRADAQSYGSNSPLVFVFKFQTEQEIMQEVNDLKASLAAANQAAAVLETAVETLTSQRDVALEQVATLSDSLNVVSQQRDALQAKITAALTALA